MWALKRYSEPSVEATAPRAPLGGPPEIMLEPLDAELRAWLAEEQLAVLENILSWHGYTTLKLLTDLSGEEVKELLNVLLPRAGYAARMRRALQKLRQHLPSTAAASSQTTAPHSTDEAEAQREASQASQGSTSHAAGSSSGKSDLKSGMRVRLQGLERRAELNGSNGHLGAFDEHAGRWEFVLQDGKGAIRVRPENVVPLEAAARDELDIPEEFRCVITRELMERPVITSDGHTYERSAIAKWLEEHGTSPKTGQELPDKVLRPNHALRAQIMAFREQKGLPPLPPWEPESQEVVQPPRPSNPMPQAVHIQSHTVMLTPGHVITPPPGARPMPLGEIDIRRLASLLDHRPDVTQALRAAFAEVHPGADTNQMNALSLAEATMQEPHMLHAFVRWMHSNQEPQVVQMLQSIGIVPQGGGQPGMAADADHALFRAAREGDCRVLERLLGERSGDQLIQDVSPSGDTLLHTAAWHGQSQVAAMLLARNHPVAHSSRNRSAPLHYAAWQGHVQVAEALLDGQANLEQRMLGGDTPLHQAAWQGHVAMLKLLIERGASVFALKDDGDTPLALATFRGHLEASRELLHRMIEGNTDSNFWSRIRNYFGCGPLHTGASSGKPEVVRLLLEANAPINDSSESEEAVLHRAIHSGSKESVQLLLEGRANLEAIRASDEQSPLQLAVLDGYTGIAGLLLEWRASLDHTRADGMKPLHVAVCREATFPPRSGEGSVIKLLAEARADPQVRSRTGVTPVALALSPGIQAPCRSAALRALIDIQADLNAALTPDGSRPLHAAVQHSLQGEAALLLECAADANVSRADGCTPLHLAAFTGSAPFAELLLGSRADASLTTQSGLTPLALARQHGFQALVRLLE